MAVTSAEASDHILPRNLHFAVDGRRIADWLRGNPTETTFWNALSIMFPHGERFFIAAVAGYRSRIADPALRSDVAAFVAQEALHTREHIEYNAALERVAPAAALDRQVGDFLAYLSRTLPPLAKLAVTCALEHFTAIMAKEVLENRKQLSGATDAYARLWTWHALEECEHKAVAFDVFRAVTGGRRERYRAFVMLPTTAIFFWFVFKHIARLEHAQGRATSLAAWSRMAWFLVGSPGILRRIAPAYVRYFSKTFHPNDIEDRTALERARRAVAAWT